MMVRTLVWSSLVSVVVGGLAALAGCGGAGGGGAAASTLVISIPDGSRLHTNSRFDLSAAVVMRNGARQAVQPQWQVVGDIGSMEGNVLRTAASAASGSIVATFANVSQAIRVEVVTTKSASRLRVVIGKDFEGVPIFITDRPRFYLVREDAEAPVYVPADPGTWSCSPSGIGTLNNDGVFAPISDGVARITATHEGTPAAAIEVTVVARAVLLSGRVLEAGTGTAVSGAVIVFLNPQGSEVGRATSGTNGRWTAWVHETATHMYLQSVPSGYHKNWQYGERVYDINYGPDTCKAPIPKPTHGLVLGNIYLYNAALGPPPPPDC